MSVEGVGPTRGYQGFPDRSNGPAEVLSTVLGQNYVNELEKRDLITGIVDRVLQDRELEINPNYQNVNRTNIANMLHRLHELKGGLEGLKQQLTQRLLRSMHPGETGLKDSLTILNTFTDKVKEKPIGFDELFETKRTGRNRKYIISKWKTRRDESSKSRDKIPVTGEKIKKAKPNPKLLEEYYDIAQQWMGDKKIPSIKSNKKARLVIMKAIKSLSNLVLDDRDGVVKRSWGRDKLDMVRGAGLFAYYSNLSLDEQTALIAFLSQEEAAHLTGHITRFTQQLEKTTHKPRPDQTLVDKAKEQAEKWIEGKKIPAVKTIISAKRLIGKIEQTFHETEMKGVEQFWNENMAQAARLFSYYSQLNRPERKDLFKTLTVRQSILLNQGITRFAEEMINPGHDKGS